MAALDKLLDLAARSGVLALMLRPNEAPQFQTSSGLQPAAKNVLDEAQMVALVRELAGPAERDLLDERLPVRFAYRGFTVEMDFTSAGNHVRIVPGLPEAVTGAAEAPAAAASGPLTITATQPGIEALFREMISLEASDLHLNTDGPPRLRLHGEMVPLDRPAINAQQMAELLWPVCPQRNREEWERDHDTDFGYEVVGLARFRCNYFMDRTGLGAVFRQIPSKIPTAKQLGLPKQILDLCWLSKGLVVVTGPTGSGKSTTLAALVDFINDHRTDHIITIEDPIEFVHTNKCCLFTQREVGSHTESFRRSLRAALREDPDIVLVGEMRDLETMAIAIETAETGHLVFGTLHTSTAPSTIDRIIDQFPADRQSQIRTMLSESLKGVIAQTLCKKIGGGRIAAFEILIVNSATANLIREGKTFQIPSIMQTQRVQGNCMLNESLLDLVKKGLIEPREALFKAVDKASLKAIFERHKIPLDLDLGEAKSE